MTARLTKRERPADLPDQVARRLRPADGMSSGQRTIGQLHHAV